MLAANARLYRRADGVVRLVLAGEDDEEQMPRRVLVIVQFLPTIAVRNVTLDEEEEKGGIGGKVRVVCEETGGNYSEYADGVPGVNVGDNVTTPYKKATAVYGTPDEGYIVDWEFLEIRNLNDLDGVISQFVRYEEYIDEKNFTAIYTLATSIGPDNEVVEKSVKVWEGSIYVEIEGGELPVPLQIDLRFIPAGTGGGGGGSGGPGGEGSGGNRWTQGDGLPRTGVESVIVLLIIGLLTSVAAAVAVIIVIRIQNKREKAGKI